MEKSVTGGMISNIEVFGLDLENSKDPTPSLRQNKPWQWPFQPQQTTQRPVQCHLHTAAEILVTRCQESGEQRGILGSVPQNLHPRGKLNCSTTALRLYDSTCLAKNSTETALNCSPFHNSPKTSRPSVFFSYLSALPFPAPGISVSTEMIPKFNVVSGPSTFRDFSIYPNFIWWVCSNHAVILANCFAHFWFVSALYLKKKSPGKEWPQSKVVCW